MINAGKYNKQISIYKTVQGKDADGFPQNTEALVLSPWAEVKNTSGYTLIASGSDFESATTRFVFRYSQKVLDAYNNADTDRKLTVEYNGRKYSVEYMRDIDDRHEETEVQGKAVTK